MNLIGRDEDCNRPRGPRSRCIPAMPESEKPEIEVTRPEGAVTEERTMSIRVERESRPLYELGSYSSGGGDVSLTQLLKANVLPDGGASKQGTNQGTVQHFFDVQATLELKEMQEHHSTCLDTKVASLVGVGHVNEATHTKLDELCEDSWQAVINDVAHDYWGVGMGYLEVVRDSADPNGEILGLHHLPAAEVWVNQELRRNHWHYDILTPGTWTLGTKKFARFGDKQRFLETDIAQADENLNGETVSEVIAFKRPFSRHRHYSMPDWMAAVPSIELMHCLRQHTFDFFLNRGVPEFMMFVTGAALETKDWDEVRSVMRAQIGLGNSRKSAAFNWPHGDIKVQIEKLALEGKTDGSYNDMSEALALAIVSSHKVPPLLAGIQIPGKLGATNELPNALMAFQVLLIGPGQSSWQNTLGATLGDSSLSPGLGLSKDSFEFKSITDEIDLGAMDTVGRMRETVPEAEASGRKIEDGLKD
jgi:hypothetical protein